MVTVTLFKNAARTAMMIVAGAATACLVPILWLAEPFVRIRLGPLRDDAFAELISGMDLILRRRELDGDGKRTIDILWSWEPCNQQLLSMWRRRVVVISSKWLRRLNPGIMAVLGWTRFALRPWINSDEHREHSLASPQLSFTDSEERRGRAFLESVGIGPNDWFVCVHARDAAWRAHTHGQEAEHNLIRNCAIENYIPAAQWIAEQGGFALRIGSVVEKPLPPGLHPRVVDYATHHRSDFLDVWLPARNRFFLGCSAGPMSVALTFNVPCAIANNMPYRHPGMGNRTFYTPKLLRRKEDGRILTFPEIAEMRLFGTKVGVMRDKADPNYYSSLGLEWIENDAEDVLGLAQDLFDHLEGRPPPPGAEALLRQYRAYYSHIKGADYIGQLGARFALRHRALFA